MNLRDGNTRIACPLPADAHRRLVAFQRLRTELAQQINAPVKGIIRGTCIEAGALPKPASRIENSDEADRPLRPTFRLLLWDAEPDLDVLSQAAGEGSCLASPERFSNGSTAISRRSTTRTRHQMNPRADQGAQPMRMLLPLAMVLMLGACAGLTGGDPALYQSLADSDVQLASRTMQGSSRARPMARRGRGRTIRPATGGRSRRPGPVSDSGYVCREYREELVVGERSGRFYHAACRDENARWVSL
jgi:hypothetical protein